MAPRHNGGGACGKVVVAAVHVVIVVQAMVVVLMVLVAVVVVVDAVGRLVVSCEGIVAAAAHRSHQIPVANLAWGASCLMSHLSQRVWQTAYLPSPSCRWPPTSTLLQRSSPAQCSLLRAVTSYHDITVVGFEDVQPKLRIKFVVFNVPKVVMNQG